MIRAGKRSKDASPAGSRGSSLRGASAAEAQRTVLRLENDDWSDEEQAFELNEGEDMPEVAGIGLADLKPLDMAVVAQMMNSTLRKRSPRGAFRFLNFGRSKKDRTSRAGSETSLQGVFRPSDSIIDAIQQPQSSSYTVSPSSSSSNLSNSKSGSVTKKRGSFVKPSNDSKNSSSQSTSSKRSVYRRASSMVEVKSAAIRPNFAQEVSDALSNSSCTIARSQQTGSLRSALNKKELKELEKKEKKEAKEARKKARKEAKKEKRARKDSKPKTPSKPPKGSSTSSSLQSKTLTRSSPPPEHRYTTEMTQLPANFDPAVLRQALTPLSSSSRSGSLSSGSMQGKPSQPIITSGDGSGQTTEISRPKSSTGDIIENSKSASELEKRTYIPRSVSDGGLAKVSEVDDSNEGEEVISELPVTIAGEAASAGDAPSVDPARSSTADGVHESLIRALSTEMLSAQKPGYDKRQSYINMQLLANDLNDLNFDFGGLGDASFDFGDLGGGVGSLGGGIGILRSNSVGPSSSERPGSGASSLFSDNSMRDGHSSRCDDDSSVEDSDSDIEDSDDESDSSSSTSETADDVSSVASISSTGLSSSFASVSSFASAALASCIDETEVDMHKKAIESGAQVELVRKIGKGSFGIVWFGLLDGKAVAVKQIELREVSEKRSLELRKSIKREVQLLQTLNCIHIVRYFGMFASKAQQRMTLIMELVPGLSVTAFVVDRTKLPERLAAYIIQQVLVALKFLEENGIIHRDVKPDNLLMNTRGVVKMIDFGTAAQLQHQQTRRSTVGTPWYCAPEVIRSEEYSHPADIWSLGCTLIELLTGKPPYDDLADVACLFKMAEGQIPPLPTHVDADCTDFLKSCLQPNPAARLTANQLLEHPWISKTMVERDIIADEITKAIDTILSSDDLRVK